jgi:hypothetical protein
VTSHIAIRRESYVAGTRQRPEVGVFVQTHAARHPVPWGRIQIGDEVWMKWSGGPVVATARVEGYRQLEWSHPEEVRRATAGFRLHGHLEYWKSLPPSFSALVVYLGGERWLDTLFVPRTRSRGESWIVLETRETRGLWLTGSGETSPGACNSSSGRRKSRVSRTLSRTLRFQVLRRDDFRCTYCGRSASEAVLHIDHVTPWSAGGRNDLENLRTACLDCNLGKGALPLSER